MKKKERIKNRLLEYFQGTVSIEYLLKVIHADSRFNDLIVNEISRAKQEFDNLPTDIELYDLRVNIILETYAKKLYSLFADYKTVMLFCNKIAGNKRIKLWKTILHFKDEPYRIETKEDGTFQVYMKDLILEFSTEYRTLMSIRFNENNKL